MIITNKNFFKFILVYTCIYFYTNKCAAVKKKKKLSIL
jgi:hypothetical protein